jgi:NADP-dependent 3-hydroxy acid dehydrogenase YdfG
MAEKVWMVRGASSGLGREIAKAALASGDKPMREVAAVGRISAMQVPGLDQSHAFFVTHVIRDQSENQRKTRRPKKQAIAFPASRIPDSQASVHRNHCARDIGCGR